MNRRSLLRTAPLVALAGCLGDRGDGRSSPDDSPQSPEATERTTTTDATPAETTTSSATETATARPEPADVEAGVFEDFEGGLDWEVLDGSVSVTHRRRSDGSRAPCLKMERGARRSRITLKLDAPLDVEGLSISAAMRATEHAYPRFQLFDDSGGELRVRAPVRAGLSSQLFNFGVEKAAGNIDLSRIVKMRFMMSGSPTLWLDSVRFHRCLPGTVAVMLDDGAEEFHSNGYPTLREKDISATAFVDTRGIGRDGVLTLEQLRELQSSGWDVCNHTVNHANLTSMGEEGQRSEILDGQRWLVDHGFTRGAEYFAYPYHNYNQTTLDIVDESHRLGFDGGYPATGAIPNEVLVPRTEVDTFEAARRMIDLTAAFGGVTCLLFHELGKEGLRFSKIVEYLHRRQSAGDVDVATASDIDELLLGW